MLATRIVWWPAKYSLTNMTNKKIPRGIRNNNPLNIRKGNNWVGERHPQTDPAFEEFESIEMGLRAAFKLLRRYITGDDGKRKPCDTVEKIISRWAPEVENATKKYIQFVADHLQIHPSQRVWFVNRGLMIEMVRAMAFVECGVWLDPKVVATAYDLL